MMRYPRVSPDIIPLSNASRKPTSKSFKDDTTATTADHITYYSSEGKTLRSRDHQFSQPCNLEATDCTGAQPASVAIAVGPAQTDNLDTPIKLQNNPDANSISSFATVGVDRLFQWGSRKRSRGARTESRIALIEPGDGDESSPRRKPRKMLRRSSIASAAMAMPPPSCGGGFYTKGNNLRSSLPAQLTSRGVEERSVSRTRRLPSPPEKAQKMSANGCTGLLMNPDSKHQPSDQETGGSGTTAAAAAEKLNLDQLEWPRICISLSRKEKEDDFFAMKGTKLPQRPKKRAKNIDKTLQYCFPGMWLADLTRSRYEVREKKCVKKKRRGLKGMESSDSE